MHLVDPGTENVPESQEVHPSVTDVASVFTPLVPAGQSKHWLALLTFEYDPCTHGVHLKMGVPLRLTEKPALHKQSSKTLPAEEKELLGQSRHWPAPWALYVF